MTVDHVYDGDTLWLWSTGSSRPAEKVKVRLIGVNTPELVPAECFGAQSTDRVKELLPVASTVLVGRDRALLDRYGRRLYYLWRPDGRFVNHEIVAEGWGFAYPVQPDTAYADLLAEAERSARSARRGLWAAC